MKKKFTRMTAFTIIIIVIFAVILSRLFYLQVVNGDYFRGIAEARTEMAISELAPRGDILDRNGIKIATNVQSFNITYYLSFNKRSDNDINKALIGAVNIICKNGDENKINIATLPLNYDVKSNSFSFNFSSKNPATVTKLANKFKDDNKLDISLNARDTFFKLAEKYKLISNYESGNYLNSYNIPIDIMRNVVALRLAIKDISYKQYEPVYIANNVKKQTAFEIQSKSNDLDGVASEVAPLRYYPFHDIGSAFIGYVGKISSNTDEYTNMGYDVSRELIGKDRLEKVLENNREMNIQLRGEPGVKYVQVDKYGKVIKETAWRDPIPGDTVVTTIDMNLQKVAEQSFSNLMKDIRDGKLSGSYPNANRGALVVMDVNTGEILAMVSQPGYDPNLFAATGGVDPETYSKLFLPDLKDPYDAVPKPMFNYATQGTAPPGSTFKPLTAIAGLSEGVITPTKIIEDLGVYRVVKGFQGKCWIYDEYGTTHGAVDVSKALQVSCNYFFYEVGHGLGYEKIGEWAARFGLGRDPNNNYAKPSTGIEIDERTGTVGSPHEYKMTWINSKMKDIIDRLSNSDFGGYTLTQGTDEYDTIEQMMINGIYTNEDPKYKSMSSSQITDEYMTQLDSIGIINKNAKKYIMNQISNFDNEASRPGDPLITAIGQGTTALTPVQMAQYYATLLNGGTRYSAHLVKEALNPDGSVKKILEPEVIDKLNLNQTYVDVIKEGMRKVTEDGGTASSVFQNYPIPTGGKTGTAQFGKYQDQVGRAAYGWFVGFAPFDKPKIVVVAVIYDGGHGVFAARTVKDIFDQYFGLNKPVQTKTADTVTASQETQNNSQN